ncbi:MAG: dihydrofolate reductase [Chitinophagaceae bacterium]|nr:dihydrofolate reductase [Chitinophagaceae bacterium]
MIINLVVAASLNNVIGKDNQLLWRLPNDMAFFKNITWGMPVIMGRKTYGSLGKPLKGRTNIVVSHNHGLNIPGVKIAAGLKEAIVLAEEEGVKQCFVIGGGEIYKQAMPLAQRIYLTRVQTVIEGDAFFPPIDEALWGKTDQADFNADNQHAYAYCFEVWERKPS